MTLSIPTEASECPLCGREALSRVVAASPDFEYRTTGNHEWTFRQCLVCDTIFLHPRPAVEVMDTIYPKDYYAFSFASSRSFAYSVKGQLDRLATRTYLQYYPGRGLICDIGASDGRLVQILSRASRAKVYGIEAARPAVREAQRRNIDVRHATMEDHEWPPETHGLLIMQQVIEHVRDPKGCLAAVAQTLVPGGTLVVETPNVQGLDARMFGRRHWGGYHTPRHFYLFHPASLTRIAESVGLEVIRVDALLSPNFWVQSVHHALTERRGRFGASLAGAFRPHPPRVIPLALFATLDLVSARLLRTSSNMRLVFMRKQRSC